MAFTQQWIASGDLFARMGVSGYTGITANRDGNVPNTLDISIAAGAFALLTDGSYIDTNNGLVAASVTGVANGTLTLWLDHDSNMAPVWSVAASAPSTSALAVGIIVTSSGTIGSVLMAPNRLANLTPNGDTSRGLMVARTNAVVQPVPGSIPAGAFLLNVRLIVPTGLTSNSSGTATVNVGKVGGTGTEFMNAQDVKTAAGSFTTLAGLGPVATAFQAQAVYNESAASTAGGPFPLNITYFVPD